jgi:hypothetical protein
MKNDTEGIPVAYLLYVVLGILLLAAGAAIFSHECFFSVPVTIKYPESRGASGKIS